MHGLQEIIYMNAEVAKQSRKEVKDRHAAEDVRKCHAELRRRTAKR